MDAHTSRIHSDGRLLEHLILHQDRTAFFEMLLPLLDSLRRHAGRELALARLDGTLGSGELSTTDVVDEVLAAAYDRFERRELPLDRWLVRLLHECVDRRASECRQATSLSDELATSDRRIEPDNAWILENESLWGELDSVSVEDAIADREAVDPSQAAEADDERRWLVTQLLAFPRTMRRAFVLQTLEGWTPAEIAKSQGRDEQTVLADIETLREAMRARIRD